MNTHNPQKPRWFNLKTVLLATIVLAIAGVSLAVNSANNPTTIVPSVSSGTFADRNGVIGSEQRELFPSPTGATDRFNEQLEVSKQYRDYTPCFDDYGKRIGERAAMWVDSSPPTKAFWRIIWTDRTAESSQLYWTEADSLDVARDLEIKSKERWRLCKTTN